MAGPIRLYFDAWAAATPKGTALGELTQAYEKKIQDVLADVGSGEFVVNRHDSQAAAGWVDTGNLVRVRLEAGGPFAWDDARYKFAFYIEDGDDELLNADEEAGDEWQRGGRGIFSVLERLIWWSSSFTNPDADVWHLDEEQGVWEWAEGQSIGRPLNRAIREWNARPNTPIPASLSKDFGVSTDSAGAAWDTADEDLTFDIGDPYLKTYLEYRDLDVEAAVTPAFVVRAWNDNGRGADKTASVVFRKGWNIREGGSRPKYAPTRSSRALVRGKSKEDAGPKYVEATYSGTTADESGKWGRRETLVPYGRTRSTSILEKAGKRALRRLKRLEEGPPTMGVTSYPKGSGSQSDGGTPAAIRDLLPYTDYETGDTVTVDIPGEYSNYEARITAISITDGENGEADVDLTFDDSAYDPVSAAGSGYGNPTGGGPGGGKTCHCLKLCEAPEAPSIDCNDLAIEDLTEEATPNGDVESGDTNWSGGAVNGAHVFEGAASYGVENAAPSVDLVYSFPSAQVFSAGVRYIVDCYQQIGGDSTGRETTFGLLGTDEESVTTNFETVTVGGSPWGHWRVCWTPSADRTGVQVKVHRAQEPASNGADWAVVDGLQLYTDAGGSSALIGTDGRAARCDHGHRHNDLLERNVDDAHIAESISFDNSVAALDGDPTNVQDAIERAALLERAGLPHSHIDRRIAAADLTSAPLGGWGNMVHGNVVAYGGYTFIGYVRGDNGDVCIDVVHRSDPETVVRTIVLHAALQDDDHAAPTLLIRSTDGKLMAAYSAHGGGAMYVRVSTASLDSDPDLASGFDAEADIDGSLGGSSYTYPTFFELPAESKIFLIYRQGTSDASTWRYSTTANSGAPSWAAQTTLLDTSSGPYLKGVRNGDDRIDFIATQGNPATSAPNIFHFYYQGGSFYNSAGVAATGSVGTSEMTLVYDGGAVTQRLADIAIAADGKPRLAWASFESSSDVHYRYGRWTGSAWATAEIVASGDTIPGKVTFYRGLSLEDSGVVAWAVLENDAGYGDLYRYTTHDGGSTWEGDLVHAGASSGVGDAFPKAVRDADPEIAVVFLFGTYTDYDAFSLGMKTAGLQETAAGGSTLVVREVGGSDIADVGEVEFDADEFAVSDEGGGVVRVEIAGHYELLMAAGTSPPEPLEDGTGTDWLYVWVAD